MTHRFGSTASLRMTTALVMFFALGLVQGVEAQTAKPGQPQTTTETKDKPGAPATGAQDAGKPACLTPAQQAELQELQLKLVDLQNKQKELQATIESKRDDAHKLEGKIEHVSAAIKGTVDADDEEKEDGDGSLPAAKASYQKDLDGLNGEINKSIEEFKSTGIQANEVKGKVEKLEKVTCPKPPQTAGGSDTPKAGPPANLTECTKASDEKLLEEYKRELAYIEQQNKYITARLAEIDHAIKQINAEQNGDPGIQKIRLDEYARQQTDQNARFIANAKEIARLKAAIKAILDKKPCPGETKTSTTSDGKHGAPKPKRVVSHGRVAPLPAASAVPMVAFRIGIGGLGGWHHHGERFERIDRQAFRR